MSKRRLVVTAVVVEGRTHAEVAAQYGMSRSWVTRLVGRYRAEGETAFEPRSRRPNTSPTQVSDVLNDQIVNLRVQLTKQGLDAGPHTIHWHLKELDGTTVSVSTIRRRLVAAGLVEPNPKKNRNANTPDSPLISRTKHGNQTSLTSGSQTAQTPKQSHGSMTTPATPYTSAFTGG